jgi:hypothetical protein
MIGCLQCPYHMLCVFVSRTDDYEPSSGSCMAVVWQLYLSLHSTFLHVEEWVPYLCHVANDAAAAEFAVLELLLSLWRHAATSKAHRTTVVL